MRPQDIIQLLIVQGNEAAQLQSEIDMKDRRLNLLKSSNEVLKAKLNDRDALTEFLKIRLDISDVRIRETEKKMAEARSEKWIEIEEAGSIVKAAKELETILKAAQKEANEYLGIEEEEEPEEDTAVVKRAQPDMQPDGISLVPPGTRSAGMPVPPPGSQPAAGRAQQLGSQPIAVRVPPARGMPVRPNAWIDAGITMPDTQDAAGLTQPDMRIAAALGLSSVHVAAQEFPGTAGAAVISKSAVKKQSKGIFGALRTRRRRS